MNSINDPMGQTGGLAQEMNGLNDTATELVPDPDGLRPGHRDQACLPAEQRLTPRCEWTPRIGESPCRATSCCHESDR